MFQLGNMERCFGINNPKHSINVRIPFLDYVSRKHYKFNYQKVFRLANLKGKKNWLLATIIWWKEEKVVGEDCHSITFDNKRVCKNDNGM